MKFYQKAPFIEGVKAMAEPASAIFAWSIVTNIALMSAGLKPFQTFCFNILAYAGSAQLAVMPLIAGDYPLWMIWLTAFIVNLRFVIFSVGLQTHFKNYSLWKRIFISYLNGDIVFAKFVRQFSISVTDHTSHTELLYFLGAAMTNWVVWQLGVIAAIFFGAYIPAEWGLGFAGTLALIALIIPSIQNKTALVSALAAGVTCIVTINFPYRLSIVCSVLAGVLAAILMDKRHRRIKQ